MELLSNPVWLSLQTGHVRFAQGDATVAGYPADVAPFAAVAREGDQPSKRGLAFAMAGIDAVYFVGQLPLLPSHVKVEPCPPILQMVHGTPPAAAAAGHVAVRELDDSDAEAMLDLTSRVFPGYFRRRTISMGRYVGVFDSGRLVAMGGERLFADRYREVSGICTDPAYTGRGYAGAVVRELAASMVDRGLTPILHLSPANTRAHSLYRSLGFRDAGELRVIKVTT